MSINKYQEALDDLEKVLNLDPADKVAKKKLEECEKQLRSSVFRNAITGLEKNRQDQLKKQDAHQPTTKEKTLSVPVMWTSNGLPKLSDLCSVVIAKEVSHNFNVYVESLKESTLSK